MRLAGETVKPVFYVDELKQEQVLDAIDLLISRMRHLKVDVDAVYPADPLALPFSMYVSKRMGIPVKTESFLREDERVLTLFSGVPQGFITEKYLSEKLKVFRKRFPRSPSVVIFSEKALSGVDIQLIRYGKRSRIHTYRFTSEAYKNFYFPVEGEFTHYSQVMWETAKKEILNFERARRIRDNSLRYSVGEFEPLKLNEPDIDIIVWEKFRRFDLSQPEWVEEGEELFDLKFEKLIKVESPKKNSSITFVLEFISQVLEEQFRTRLAYMNCEIVEQEGVLIVPSVKEMMEGVVLKLEIILRERKPSRMKGSLKRLVSLLKGAFRSLIRDVMFEEAFRPHVDYVLEENVPKATIYVNWFFDNQMVDAVFNQINKKWLLSRLYRRKKFLIDRKELFRLLEEFEFNVENASAVFSLMESMWKQNPMLFKALGVKLRDTLEEKGLWPLIHVYALRFIDEPANVKRGMLSFLVSLKGYESFHEMFARENRFFSPVLTKRIYRPNWERVIKENLNVRLTREPLNPESPVTYTLVDENGNYLGVIPEVLGHYISAKEDSGKRVVSRKLYFDGTLFSSRSYWIEIECV